MSDSESVFRRGDVSIQALSPRLSALQCPSLGAFLPLSPELARVLAGCDEPRPISEQVERARRQIPLPPETIRQALEAFRREKLLVSEREVFASCLARAGEESTRAITTLAVPTRDRTASLERSVETHLRNARSFGREPVVLVVDSSTEESRREANRERLRDLQQRYGGEFRYCGEEEIRDFLGKARARLPGASLAFALTNSLEVSGLTTLGTNRNAIYLDTLGESVLYFDDDVECRTSLPKRRLAQLRIEAVPRYHCLLGDSLGQFYEGELVREERDLLGECEKLLGKSLAACLTGGGSPSLGALEAISFRGLLDNRGTVVTVCPAVVGDCARRVTTNFLALEGEDRESLISSEIVYARRRLTRQTWDGVRQETICRPVVAGPKRTQAYDHGRLSAPFPPFGRGQDNGQAAVVAACFESAYWAYLPLTVEHLPPVARQQTLRDLHEGATRFHFAHCLIACLRSRNFTPGIGAPEQRLNDLGKHLLGIAALGPADFEAYLRRLYWEHLAFAGNGLQAALARFGGAPATWASDVNESIRCIEAKLFDPAGYLPIDFREGRGEEEALRLTRQALRHFGELLVAWPELVAGCRRLREEGIRLSRPL